ncbi:MAG TPA: tRNA lysidine(34) synthetase TilS, partial [Candidatus Angelobacter sp.]
AELARGEEDYWSAELAQLLPRLIMQGKPSRSGRSTSGDAEGVLALDIAALRALPLALQRQVLHATAERLGVCLEFKHIQQLTALMEGNKQSKGVGLPDGLVVNRTVRELQFSRNASKSSENYSYLLPIPGEITVLELGSTIRATLISDGKQKVSGYNTASLLNPNLLGPELKVRNWRAGDRFFPAHSQSPKKVKELLQPGRLGEAFSLAQRKTWPVIEYAGQIVWMRGFPVSRDFASSSGDAILIEEEMKK